MFEFTLFGFIISTTQVMVDLVVEDVEKIDVIIDQVVVVVVKEILQVDVVVNMF